MAIKSNNAIKPKSFGSVAKSNAFKGSVDSSSVAGNTIGLNPRKVQSIMEGIDSSIIRGDNERLTEVVRRSGGKNNTLQTIDPIPSVRQSSAKAFAENT